MSFKYLKNCSWTISWLSWLSWILRLQGDYNGHWHYLLVPRSSPSPWEKGEPVNHTTNALLTVCFVVNCSHVHYWRGHRPSQQAVHDDLRHEGRLGQTVPLSLRRQRVCKGKNLQGHRGFTRYRRGKLRLHRKKNNPKKYIEIYKNKKLDLLDHILTVVYFPDWRNSSWPGRRTWSLCGGSRDQSARHWTGVVPLSMLAGWPGWWWESQPRPQTRTERYYSLSK